jgi:hypothetical protein
MNYLCPKNILPVILLAWISLGTCQAQYPGGSHSKNPEKALFGKTLGSHKKSKVKESRAVRKAKKKQEKNQKKIRKDYAKSVEQSRKRAYDIQSPEVQARMKEDKKNIASRDKAKKKHIKTSTRKAGKKYK